MFRIEIFGTGSSGNCALVSDGKTNILVDCGVRLENVKESVMIADIAAVLLSHSHGDHTKHLKPLTGRYAQNIYATEGTFRALGKEYVPSAYRNIVRYCEPFTIDSLRIMPFPLSHDAAEPCGYYIKNEIGETLVFASDTGTMEHLELEADGYVIEANYDEVEIERRLESGEMPYEGLHGRLTSEFGHLSVQQAAAWLKKNAKKDSHIILLSPHAEVLENNKGLFDEFVNVTMPTKFPGWYEFGAKCPF